MISGIFGLSARERDALLRWGDSLGKDLAFELKVEKGELRCSLEKTTRTPSFSDLETIEKALVDRHVCINRSDADTDDRTLHAVAKALFQLARCLGKSGVSFINLGYAEKCLHKAIQNNNIADVEFWSRFCFWDGPDIINTICQKTDIQLDILEILRSTPRYTLRTQRQLARGAVIYGNFTLYQYLVKSEVDLSIYKKQAWLGLAISRGHLNIVKDLVEGQTEFRTVDLLLFQTAPNLVGEALRYDQYDTALYLHEKGFLISRDDTTFLFNRACRHGDYYKIFSLMAVFRVKLTSSHLRVAILERQARIAKLLIKSGISFNLSIKSSGF